LERGGRRRATIGLDALEEEEGDEGRRE